MTAANPEPTSADDQQPDHQPDATNQGVSTPDPAEGSDDVVGPDTGSPQG